MVGAPTCNRGPTRAATAEGTGHDHLLRHRPEHPDDRRRVGVQRLGQPEREVRYGFATTGPDANRSSHPEEAPTAKRVMVAAGLACDVAAGALLGVMLFTYTDSAQPTVVAPGPTPQHAVVVGPSTAAPAPKPVVSEQSTAPTVVIPAPRVACRRHVRRVVATPPPAAAKGDTTVVVDIPIPDYPRCLRNQASKTQSRPNPRIRTPNRQNRRSPIDPNFKQPEPPKPPDLQPGKFQAPQPQTTARSRNRRRSCRTSR